ncbi:MAG: histidine phosphatase family protein [Candidatus Pristimantibacillus sp.]
MEIMLIRHGISEISNLPRQSLHEYNRWRDDYDRLGVQEPNCERFEQARTDIAHASVLYTSGLYRAQQSCSLLRPETNVSYNDVFDEVRFHPPSIKGVKCNTKLWSFLAGTLWYAGITRDGETILEVKNRASEASEILIKSAMNGKVALVGHGFFNLFIFKELRKRGWEELNKYSTKNWSCTRLRGGQLLDD